MSAAPPITEFVESAAELPSFRLLLPSGWTRHSTDADDERALLERMRERLKPLGRPELDFRLTAGVKAAFRELRAKEGIAVFLPTGLAETMSVPMSISAVRVTGPDGRSLDDQVAGLFRDHGATFLGEDRTVVRWRRTFTSVPGGEPLGTEQVNHLVPVPGTGRRIGVLLSTAILRDPAEPIEGAELDAMVALADAVASTFAWSPEAAHA